MAALQTKCLIVVAVALALVFCGLGIWSAVILKLYSPVYEEVSCHTDAVGVALDPTSMTDQLFSIFGSDFDCIDISVKVRTTCENPNPFDMTVKDSEPGVVRVGSAKKDGGLLHFPPGLTFLAEASSEIEVSYQLTLDASVFGLGLAFIDSQIPVMMDMLMALEVEGSLIFTSVKYHVEMDQTCGFRLIGLKGLIDGISPASVGPMLCSDLGTLDPSEIPSTGKSSSSSVIRIPATDEVYEAEDTRDLVLPVAIVVSFSLGALLLLCSFFCCWRCVASTRDSSGGPNNDPQQ